MSILSSLFGSNYNQSNLNQSQQATQSQGNSLSQHTHSVCDPGHSHNLSAQQYYAQYQQVLNQQNQLSLQNYYSQIQMSGGAHNTIAVNPSALWNTNAYTPPTPSEYNFNSTNKKLLKEYPEGFSWPMYYPDTNLDNQRINVAKLLCEKNQRITHLEPFIAESEVLANYYEMFFELEENDVWQKTRFTARLRSK